MGVASSLREPQGSWQSGLSWGEGVVIVREVREIREFRERSAHRVRPIPKLPKLPNKANDSARTACIKHSLPTIKKRLPRLNSLAMTDSLPRLLCFLAMTRRPQPPPPQQKKKLPD